jgi:Tol biopolymer transport system component
MAIPVRVAGIVLALGAPLCAAQALTGPSEMISQPFFGTTELGALFPSISDDGRYVAFQAQHPQFDFAYAVYIVDRQAPLVATRIGTDCALEPGCELTRPHISGNGRYVVFESSQGFGMGADSAENDSDVFVWDRQTSTTQRISLGVGGVEPDGQSWAGDISRDGRYVVFESRATNLVASPSLAGAPTQVVRSYWFDRQTSTMKLVYEGSATEARNVSFFSPRITPNGRYVLAARDGLPMNMTYAINWDALNGTTGYSVPDARLGRYTYAMTQDRRYIAGTVGDGSAWVYRMETPTLAVQAFNTLPLGSIFGVELSSGAGYLAVDYCRLGDSARRIHFDAPRSVSYDLGLSAVNNQGCASLGLDMTPDGRYVVLSSYDVRRTGMPYPFDDDMRNDVFLVVNPLWRPAPENLVAAITSVPANSRNVKVSADGRIGVFESEIPASEFGPYTDTNNSSDVFRYLADFQQVELVSTADGVAAFPAGARNPAMSADGEVVVFEAPDGAIPAQNLGPAGQLAAPANGAAGVDSVFLRRIVQSSLQRLSTSTGNGAPNGSSANPSVSPDGRWVGFATDASDINPGADPNAVRDVVAIDLQGGQRHCVSTCGAVVADGASDRPSVSNYGQVAFESSSAVVQKAGGLAKGTSIRQILLRNVVAGTSQVVSRSPTGQAGNGASERPSISSAGTAVAYQSAASNLDDSGNDGRTNVFRFAIVGGNQRLSRRRPGGGKATTIPLDGDSVQAAISGDGRFVAFQTAATNLDDADGNGVVDLAVFDSRGATVQRVADGFGGAESNGASLTPHLNHNGTVVGFHSFATNLDSDADAASATSAPYKRGNPLAADVVFADAFE